MKRSERLVNITKYLMARPHTLIPLPFFAQQYDAAKSSISEDLGILKRTLAAKQDGVLETVAGAAGGVRYIPFCGEQYARTYLAQLAQEIQDPDRILPGGFVYMSDILGSPQHLRQIGKLIATRYAYSHPDYVMTIETKGISLAQAVSMYLNIPFVTVRRRPKVTEGATLSVNYVASSSDRVEKMELANSILKPNSSVLIVDDFVKGGGTLNGMRQLVKEFKCTVNGMCILCEAYYPHKRMVDDYLSLISISKIDTENNKLSAQPGNFLAKTDFDHFQK